MDRQRKEIWNHTTAGGLLPAVRLDMKKIPSANFSREKLGDYAKHAEAFFNAGDKPFFLSVNYPTLTGHSSSKLAGFRQNP